MFDIATVIWIGVGVAYTTLFVVDLKVWSKKTKTTRIASK
jgi:hypothetical protein